ncbi:MAG: N-acetylmuramic acid 6-phosphate etherase [candidate division Zixibacteria bacterium RBG_19FT_COMBO_42_43]|nr:MAG: N-acetylmuramic acid 6-phosphate etherase [candidate division Zixibacteria bacterium RBG_19FT_COMBO_42_43]
MLSKKIFDQIKSLITESRNPKTSRIDSLSTADILKLINSEDKTVPQIVEKQIPRIAKAVELLVKTFRAGGRLFYIGAGTSGRLGVLDAAECPPTFGTDPKMIRGIIAGGYKTLIRSKEGVEDNFNAAGKDLAKVKLNKKDILVGIAASRRTPYVLGGLKHAKKIGCKTIFIYCNPHLTSPIKIKVDVEIPLIVGPEVIMGSTRMKAGTAQKLVLNMLSTTAMIKLGKVYQNMMVDLKATSQKLVERSKRTIMIVTGVDYRTASEYLKKADGSVKTALVMILAKADKKEAQRRLAKSDGFVRRALKK